ncbi:NADH dehydrogenase [ubiquinone] 1 alpha subcomplex assembly factor 8 isoform X1 [Mustelus asterias]
MPGKEDVGIAPSLLFKSPPQCVHKVTSTLKRKHLPEASAYGRCVAANTQGSKDLRKDMCAKEFQALKSCFTLNAKKAR